MAQGMAPGAGRPWQALLSRVAASQGTWSVCSTCVNSRCQDKKERSVLAALSAHLESPKSPGKGSRFGPWSSQRGTGRLLKAMAAYQ